jgi:hypothetical protein
MSDSNYSNVGKKRISENKINLVNVFQQWAIDFYKDIKQDKNRELMNIKNDLLIVDSKKEKLGVFLAKTLKEKEQLVRKEMEISQDLRKIAYMTEEKYNLFMFAFSVFAIFILPLTVTVIVWLVYTQYGRMRVNKIKEYIND